MNKILLIVLAIVVVGGGLAVWAWPRSAAPVLPEPAPETMTLKVFFGNRSTDPDTLYCERVYPVVRTVPKTASTARVALEQLLAGPTEEEKAQGFFTALNPGVKINSLAVTEGLARVDFSDELEAGVGGSCRVTAIRAQINETLKQFSTVIEVEISVAGRTEEILQP